MTKNIAAVALVSVACLAASACKEAEQSTSSRLDEALAPPAASAPARDGVAAAVVIDVSGSMDDRARDGGDRGQPKIEIARRAARDLVAQFVRYARDHPEETVLVGLYEFSRRAKQPDCRPVIPMGAPDLAKAALAIDAMRPEGGTPIGSAMIEAKRELDRTGMSRRHLLLITDGENTNGASPTEVMAALTRRPVSEQPSVYFVAFDIEADRFQSVRDAGALVMAAANATQLDTTLDTLLRERSWSSGNDPQILHSLTDYADFIHPQITQVTQTSITQENQVRKIRQSPIANHNSTINQSIQTISNRQSSINPAIANRQLAMSLVLELEGL